MRRTYYVLPAWITGRDWHGPPVGYEYRVPEGHPCYGCRMYANPCVYPCNKFREKKIDRTADEIQF